MDLKIKYGLIVTDPGNWENILHFCGYSEPITERDVESLREDLKNDPEMGLQDKWGTVIITEAPDKIVKEYQHAFNQDSER